MNAPQVRETRSTCPYCGTGCGVLITSQAGTITGVRGDPDHPANFGRLCSKGSTLHQTTLVTGRALHPELRTDKTAPRQPTAWTTALTTAARHFATALRDHGPDSVAFYISGQLLTEDYYVFNKLARALVGTNNIDSNSRLCMSSAVAGYKATLGMDSVPCCYEDLEASDCLLIAGANPAWAHPVLFRRIEAARAARPGQKIIVVDPRRTDTAAMADLHLQIEPGSDVVLYAAMLNVLIREHLIDPAFIADHTEGFAALQANIEDLTPEAAAVQCGVPAEDIVTAARLFGQARAPLSLWCQGLNQSSHGTHNAAALIHLHLATGTLGRPGMGPFSLTGQPNAMGGREVGAMANLLGAHRDLGKPADRADMAALWGIPEIPAQPGLTAVELFEAVRAGRIKALWIACTNPAHSLPDQTLIREALAACPFVVVQEAFADTETCAYADLLLPAATWGEKEGTVTNSERRITRVRAAIPPPGEARPDWQIARDFGLALGAELGRAEEAGRLLGFADTSSVFAEHAATTRGRDLDFSGLDYAHLAEAPRQWPFPSGAGEGQARLYGDGRFPTPSGRARFVLLERRPTAEATDATFPLHLNSGRLRDQWHGMSRTGRLARLYAHDDRARLHLHPEDMARQGLSEYQLVRLDSRRGSAVLPVAANPDIKPGGAYLAMHWGSTNLSHPGANLHMGGFTDSTSRQPELKHAAIRLAAADLPWRLTLLRAWPGLAEREASESLLALKQTLAPLLGEFPYASLTLAGREQPLLVLRLAAAEAPTAESLQRIALESGLADEDSLTYHDRQRGIVKRARITAVGADDYLAGLLLAGETVAESWLLEHMAEGGPIGPRLRWIFAATATPPGQDTPSRGRIVCNCHNVAEADIRTAIAQGADLDALQQTLKCGTACGSCVPEIKRMLPAEAIVA